MVEDISTFTNFISCLNRDVLFMTFIKLHQLDM